MAGTKSCEIVRCRVASQICWNIFNIPQCHAAQKLETCSRTWYILNFQKGRNHGKRPYTFSPDKAEHRANNDDDKDYEPSSNSDDSDESSDNEQEPTEHPLEEAGELPEEHD